jgi:hypothetical protein
MIGAHDGKIGTIIYRDRENHRKAIDHQCDLNVAFNYWRRSGIVRLRVVKAFGMSISTNTANLEGVRLFSDILNVRWGMGRRDVIR